jgi:hypothetical protein
MYLSIIVRAYKSMIVISPSIVKIRKLITCSERVGNGHEQQEKTNMSIHVSRNKYASHCCMISIYVDDVYSRLTSIVRHDFNRAINPCDNNLPNTSDR